MRPNLEEIATTPVPVLRVTLGDERKERNAAGFVWANFVEANVEAFSAQLGWFIGERLGCGYYGCVFESDDPWVVKITRDPTEGPTWAFIADLFTDPEIAHHMGGFCRVNDVARVRPDVLWVEPADGGGTDEQLVPVYAIQRESATPIFHTDGHNTFLTERTAAELQLPDELLRDGRADWFEVLGAMDEVAHDTRERIIDLSTMIVAVNEYRQAAEQYWRLLRLLERTSASFEREQIQERMAGVAMTITRSARAVSDRTDGTANLFGDVLGRTLFEAFDAADMVIADLHNFNLGWRNHEVAGGSTLPRTVVVTDPGVAITPWQPDVREVDITEQALERNGVDVRAHLNGKRAGRRRRKRSGKRIA